MAASPISGNMLIAQSGGPTVVINQSLIGYNTEHPTLEHAAIEALAQTLDPKAKVLDIASRAELQHQIDGHDPDRKGSRSIETPEDWAEGLCYVKLRGIHRDSRDLINQLRKWDTESKTGIIIDARGAAGTNLEGMKEIVNLFVSGNQALYSITTIDDKAVDTQKAAKNNATLNTPCIMIVNTHTTAATELLAGILKHYNTLLLLGQSSSGDNRIRSFLPVDKKHSLYIGTQKMLVAADISYEETGITPDIVVSTEKPKHTRTNLNTESAGEAIREELQQNRALLDRIGDDHVLERASDILLAVHALKTGDAHAGKND